MLKVKPENILEFTLVLEEGYFDGVADSRITNPKCIKRKEMYSPQQLADFNDLVETVISVITHYGFDIVEEHQSNRSYAYYITFYPTDSNGGRWEEAVQIRFRIADHRGHVVDEPINRTRKRDPITILQSFCIGSTKFPSYMSVITAARDICKQLSKGDYSVLDRYK